MSSSPALHSPRRRWLVLGAAGFVGRAVCRALSDSGREIIGAGLLCPPALEFWEPVDVFDVTQLRAVLQKLKPNVLFNAVGHPSILPAAALEDFYVRSTRNVLESVADVCPGCRVILTGSAAEYGNTPETGAPETMACRPLTDYGRAKCEQSAVASAFAAKGLSVISARLFNLIGPRQREELFPQALTRRIRKREHPLVVENADHLRDWVDVRDTARAVILASESPNMPTLLNVCTGRGRSVGEVAEIIAALAAVKVDLQPGIPNPEKISRSIGNPALVHGLGWQPKHILETSLTHQWNHPE